MSRRQSAVTKVRNGRVGSATRGRWDRLRVEALEDRSTPAVTVTFLAGVLTFTSDGANDNVQIQATPTFDTVDYNAGGIGLTTQPGVTKVVYDGNGGDDSLIVGNGGGNLFAPVNGITYNGGGQPGDSLQLLGGAATWKGTYNPTGVTSGSVGFTNTPGALTQTTTFTGVTTVRNSTKTAGITVTTPGTNDVINVAKGPVLGDVGSISQGPVLVDGGDRDDHGHFHAGMNEDGWLFMEQATNFVNSNAFNAATPNTLLAVGVTGGQAKNAINSVASVLGLSVTFVTGAAVGTENFNNYRVLYVPSSISNVSGGITQADLNLLNARTTDVRNFINGGGGVYAQTEDGLTSPYGWLQIPNPLTIQAFGGGGISDPLRKTPAAIAAGFTITDAELSNGVPYHNVFTGPPGFNNLLPFVLDDGANNVLDGMPPGGDDRVVALGLGAQKSAGLGGGGPSTAITFGSGAATHPQMFVNQTTVVTVDGAGGDDTVNVQHGGLTTTTINIADSGGTGGDKAFLFGTTSPDDWDVNFTTAGQVKLGGEKVNYTGTLETLTVVGQDEVGTTGDKFLVYPDKATALNIQGGQPVYPSVPGDTLQLSVVQIGNPAGDVVNPQLSNPALPDGTLTSSSHKTVTWTSIETFPVPLGLGGQFDFENPGSVTQAGWLKVHPNDTVAAGAYKGVAGWLNPVLGFDRKDLGQTPNSPDYKNLYIDGAWGGDGPGGEGTFRVRVPANQTLLVSLNIGDTYFLRDSIEVYVEGVKVATIGTAAGEFNTFTTTAISTDNFLDVVIRDAGGHSYWTATALDVRPLGLVRPLTLARQDGAPGTTKQLADGTTTDTYAGVGAEPGEILTLLQTAAGVNSFFDVFQDVDPAQTGVQVKAQPDGTFTFTMRRPTGSGPAVVGVLGNHAEGSSDTALSVNAGGNFVQQYDLPATRRLDFNAAGSPTAAGYYGVDLSAYAGPALNALGWVGPAPAGFDRGSADPLLRDGHWNPSAADATFHLDLPAGDYYLTVVLGDPAFARTDVTVAGVAGTLFGPPTKVSTPAGQSVSSTFKASTTGAGAIEFRVSGGASFWSLQAVEARPFVAPTGLTGPASPPADGVTPVTMTGTGAVPNSLLTVTTAFGTVTSADASGLFTGVQVLADAGGNFGFTFVPAYSPSAATADVTATDVTGARVYAFAQPLVGGGPGGGPGNTQRFDFDGPSNATAATGFTSVRGSKTYTTAGGFGWATARVEFERTAGSATALGATATQAPLYQDGVWGYGSTPGKFQVAVTKGTGGINVRAYVGDSYAAWGGITVQVEGGGAPTSAPLTSVNRFVAVTLPTGGDADNDGVFWVQVSNASAGSIWVLNGLDIAVGALPPALPLTAGYTVTGPAGPALTAAQLAPIADAAIARWAAAGITDEQLAVLRAVRFEVADLGGRLGEQTGDVVRIDDDAARVGWFVDSTPLLDEEFGAGGPAGVDLVTVVAHELGHVLGYIDLDAAVSPDSVMAETLAPGVRRAPAAAGWADLSLAPCDEQDGLGVWVG